MANICCDDVIFYTEGNPEGLYDLWEDLEWQFVFPQENRFHRNISSWKCQLHGME